MTIIRDYADLSDSWVDTHPATSTLTTSGAAILPLEAITRFGVTADSPLNTYSAGKPLDPYARQFWGKRLDYILYRQPSRPHSVAGREFSVLKAVDSRVIMTGKVPGHQCSFSDHFGLEATLEIRPRDDGDNGSSTSGTTPFGVGAAPTKTPSELSNASIATTIQALASCYRFSRERARKELAIFASSLIVLVILAIGSAWLPHSWINPIFIVFTVFVAWLGTTMLYEGFLYGNWECNALMNVIEELEIYRKGLEIQSGRRDSF